MERLRLTVLACGRQIVLGKPQLVHQTGRGGVGGERSKGRGRRWWGASRQGGGSPVGGGGGLACNLCFRAHAPHGQFWARYLEK